MPDTITAQNPATSEDTSLLVAPAALLATLARPAVPLPQHMAMHVKFSTGLLEFGTWLSVADAQQLIDRLQPHVDACRNGGAS